MFAQIGGNGGTAVTLTGTQTLTNKTLTAPTIASANLTTALTLAGAAGTNGQVLTSAGSGLPSWTTLASGLSAATQAEMEAATSNTVAATPSNTNFHPGVAKCWGTTLGDPSGGSIPYTLGNSRNIASFTDDGAGLLTFTFTTAFSSADYVITATAVLRTPFYVCVRARAAGSFGTEVTTSDVATDCNVSFACFGDQ